MSDDFSIDFGKAKEFTKEDLPPEDNYTLLITDYKLAQPKKDESKGKGFNVVLDFKIEDYEDDKFKVKHWIWVDKENPWGAKPFFEALTGEDLEDDALDLTDVDRFIGDTVGCAMVHESYDKGGGKLGWKLVPQGPNAWYSV